MTDLDEYGERCYGLGVVMGKGSQEGKCSSPGTTGVTKVSQQSKHYLLPCVLSQVQKWQPEITTHYRCDFRQQWKPCMSHTILNPCNDGSVGSFVLYIKRLTACILVHAYCTGYVCLTYDDSYKGELLIAWESTEKCVQNEEDKRETDLLLLLNHLCNNTVQWIWLRGTNQN